MTIKERLISTSGIKTYFTVKSLALRLIAENKEIPAMIGYNSSVGFLINQIRHDLK